MKRTMVVVLLSVLAMSLTGCKTYHESANGLDLYGLQMEPLKRSEYKVLDNTTGESTVTRILFFKFGEGGATYSSGLAKHSPVESTYVGDSSGFGSMSIPVLGYVVGKLGEMLALSAPNSTQAALYKALENAPEADALLCPRVKTEGLYFPILFGTSTSTVKAKAVQIKKD